MSDSEAAASLYLEDFLSQAAAVIARARDPFLNRLYFAHAVTLMEKYLSDVLLSEIRASPTALKRLANMPKFRDQCLPIPQALNTSVSDYIVRGMQNEVWHRLNDVQAVYSATLRVDFQIPKFLRDAIIKRHHIIHRNSTDLQGNAVAVTDDEVLSLYSELTRFLKDIDRKYLCAQGT